MPFPTDPNSRPASRRPVPDPGAPPVVTEDDIVAAFRESLDDWGSPFTEIEARIEYVRWLED